MAERVVLGEPRGRWVLAATVLGSGVALLDATIVNVALPSIGRGLDADFAGLQWTVNGYVLTLAAFILLGGSLGDVHGRRRIFIVGVVWFGVASLLCGLAPSVEALIAARVLQGVGGALLTPASLAILSASFRGADRARAIGAWSGLSGIAAALGPVVGGLLVEVSWRLVFLVNLPLCVVVVVVAQRHVPETRDDQADPRLDVAGAVLGAAGLAGVTFALIAAGEQGASPTVVLSAVAGLASLLAFLAVEARSSHPMMPLAVFRVRQFRSANAVTFAVYAALGGLFLLLVVHLQTVARYSPLAAGAALLPVTVAMLLLSTRSGELAARIGPRLQMSVGPLLCAGGVLLLRGVEADGSYLRDVLPGAVLFGLGLATTVAPLTSTVLGAVEDRLAGLASGVNNAVARTASLLAVAVLPVAAGIEGADYTDPERFADGFRTAMLLTAGLLVLGGVLAALTIRNDVCVHEPERHRSCPVDGPPVEARLPGRPL